MSEIIQLNTTKKEFVNATGFEPVTPTLSR